MSKFYPLTVAKVKHETRDAVSVTFAVPPELKPTFAYQQGQHLTLRAMIDGEDVRRSYSICSAVQDEQLRVAIKKTPGGLFSNWANEQLAPGTTLEVMPPMGHFNVPLDANSERHYLAFAAGSGITPILSIIKTTLLAEPKSRFTLVYGNRASSSVIFRDELTDLKDQYMGRLKLVYVMSREQQDIELFNGRITGEKCSAFLKHWIAVEDIDIAFICGPEDMMHGVSKSLQDAGMAKEKIRIELFAASIPKHEHKPRKIEAGAAHQTEVTVIMDGSAASFTMDKDKESILDAGLRAGIDMRYSCKGGVCSTCRCKVAEGKVEMDVNYALEDYEVARGFVLSCQAFPITDKVVVDFDQHE
ncbi:phenylacetate-CoA oxygenase/reductase subunit PaaK [Massilia sp. Dwa41.01b]|uniref:1,2-phenylacetyl-CoA epoxidase subunit PaaE n=1 Tax=unclassified Massilia TaxID=2609279 RepID=UPI001602550B|nr:MULTISPECIES: 1,2-phenylacetyl-CoA epoxidase subunit PaaE [unclassified Massilia]QNA90481.1 phenylacetate-CoA oxygenase/reductase subunit PaaK [Massilia sp. Dwa41.01b]QNA97711.1 phenylacetate-CoA oxygenase/reductase subunit PaaK [Massilia sp. Se16.2.3]